MSASKPLFQRYMPFRAYRGTRGVLYLCSDLESREAIALKAFEPELSTGHTPASLQAAAESWMRIGTHPHVVAAHRVPSKDPLCLVLDFVEPAQGLDSPALRAWLRSPLAPEAACAVALGIARGMRHATDRVPGLVHGDLRPDNVLIGRDLRARVTNFGLGTVDETGNGVKRCYWAPERWTGANHLGSDIYAFGFVLLEMLLGTEAVQVREQDETPRALFKGAAYDLALGSELSNGLRSLVAACLAPTPDLRPSSWAEVDRRLTALWPSLTELDVPRIPDAETASREETLMRAWSSQAVGHALRDRGAIDAALVTYRGVARTAAREGDVVLAATAVCHIARMLRALGQLEAATRELLHALELRRSIRDSRGQAEAMRLLGDVYARRYDYDNSLASFFAAARLYAEAGDRMGVARCRQQMAPVLEAVGRTTEARGAQAESAAILSDLDD
ncbi:MAG: serine/threonine protein kinase [Myxococcota bacterium]